MALSLEEAKNVLRTRTSKIIGGYIAENLFVEEYQKAFPGRPYSQGWWGGIENSDDRRLTFFVVKDTLSELDEKVIERLQRQNYDWKQLVHVEDAWYVKDCDSSVPLNQFIERRGLRASRGAAGAAGHTGDPYIERCIEEYERQGTVEKIAESITIEDSFLNRYYTISNIDLIGEDRDGIPVYMEIKFKNEFRHEDRLVFGVDQFQYDQLFRPFWAAGMGVCNVILYNDVKAENNVSTTVIFDFLDKKRDQKLIWKIRFIEETDCFDTYTFSRGKTAWSGAGGRTVYCLPLSTFTDFGERTLPKEAREAYPAGGWGRCPNCGSWLVIRRDSAGGGEHFQCLDCCKKTGAVTYVNHSDKYAYIRGDDGVSYYVGQYTYSRLANPEQVLTKGARVSFTVRVSASGKKYANHIKRI